MRLGAQPGRVVFTLRAYLVDTASRQVIASREFNETVVASSETPYAGVVAAKQPVQAGFEIGVFEGVQRAVRRGNREQVAERGGNAGKGEHGGISDDTRDIVMRNKFRMTLPVV